MVRLIIYRTESNMQALRQARSWIISSNINGSFSYITHNSRMAAQFIFYNDSDAFKMCMTYGLTADKTTKGYFK